MLCTIISVIHTLHLYPCKPLNNIWLAVLCTIMEFGLVDDSYINWCNVFLFVENDEGGAVQGEAGEGVELRSWETRRHSNEDDTKVRLESLWFFTNSAYNSSFLFYLQHKTPQLVLTNFHYNNLTTKKKIPDEAPIFIKNKYIFILNQMWVC